MSKNIIVPTDFSRVSDTSLKHAIKVAKTIDAEINLVHVVGKESEEEEGLMKLNIVIARTKEKEPSININPIVIQGSIFEDIAELAKTLEAVLIIMGTHGRRGLQFITGSRAVRVVSSSDIPFVIVQNRDIKPEGYDDIVVPLDLHKETKQKLHVVRDMAKYFNSRVHLIIPFEKDEFLSNALDRNLNYAKSYFEEQAIDYTAKVLSKEEDDFDDEIIAHAASMEADLIAIMNLKDNSLMGLFGSSYVEGIITNAAQVPVMILNPRSTSFVSSTLDI